MDAHQLQRCIACFAFQSTPANTGGRCQARAAPSPRAGCFNPRPPILAGDAQRRRASCSGAHVSIHARQYWRAMPGALAVRDGLAFVSIHARQYWRAMPRGHLHPRQPDRRFQSTPANTGGRCQAALPTHACCLGFNPRPPILAGDAVCQFPEFKCLTVSIHARQYWRAMPLKCSAAVLHELFQSTPANTGGRCRRCGAPVWC